VKAVVLGQLHLQITLQPCNALVLAIDNLLALLVVVTLPVQAHLQGLRRRHMAAHFSEVGVQEHRFLVQALCLCKHT
jgi:hypothetical protein